MQKSILVKATICLVTTLLVSINTPKISVTAVSTTTIDTAVAGIAVSLDRYYTATALEKTMEVISNDTLGVLSLKALEGEETIEDNIIDQESIMMARATEPEPENISPYANIGISIAMDYVNIRSEATQESELVGKLYQGSTSSIIETIGDWVKIKSGSVEGYILSSYLAIGSEAEKVADQYGTKLATVTTETLYVREEKNVESTILTLVPEGEILEVLKEYDEWVKIQIDGDLEGFVSKEFVDITTEFDEAISVEEEKARLEAEEEAKRAEQEAIAKVEAAKVEAAKAAEKAEQERKKLEAKKNDVTKNTQATSTDKSSSDSSTNDNSTSNSSSVSSNEATSSSSSEIVSYAKKFLGNRYVYGGTSLTGGTDCSGFTMSIYAHFGKSIGRSSRDQVYSGTAVNFDSLATGDLIFYTGSGGTINHVAMYIGGGQVIHASNRRDGIKISNMYYRTPYKARRIIN